MTVDHLKSMPREALERHAMELEAEVNALQGSVDARFKELAVLTRMLEGGNFGDNSATVFQRPSGSGAIRRALPLFLAPASLKRVFSYRKQVKALKASDWFDAEWYLAHYPDIAQSRWRHSPEGHYVRFGAHEGRDPGPAFSTQRYLDENPDVAELGINPLWHYLQFGQWEGRMALPSEQP